jgi:hypothetical protein
MNSQYYLDFSTNSFVDKYNGKKIPREQFIDEDLRTHKHNSLVTEHGRCDGSCGLGIH